MNRRKLWITLSVAAVVIVAAVVTLVFVFAKPAANTEDYAKATITAQEVAKQYKAFNDAGQALVSGAGQDGAAATTTQLTAKLDEAFDAMSVAQKELAASPAVKQDGTDEAFKAYDAKAQKFTKLAEQYRVSIPLYAAMRETCSQIGKVTVSNLLEEVKMLSESILDQSKDATLARFDKQTGGCINAATKLNDSGSDSFARLGGLFATFLTDMRTATETRFDDTDKIGASKAKANYDAAGRASDTKAVETLKSISEQQTSDNEATEYEAEIASLIKSLEAKK